MSTVEELLEQATDAEERGDRLKARAIELRRQADELVRQERPILPTLDQLEGIVAAVERITSGETPASHLGDPCAPGEIPYAVAWARDFLIVRDLAPWSSVRGSGKLWRFTDPEVDSILGAVRQAGGAVVEWWLHESGISVRIAPEPALPLAETTIRQQEEAASP